MMRLTLTALVGVLTFVGAVSAQYPEPNELQLAKHERFKATQALDAAMVESRLQREAGVPDQEASAVEAQARQRLRVATERVRELLAEVRPLRVCVLPDGTTHSVNTTVSFGGSLVRCVVVLDRELVPASVGWTPVLR